MICNIIMFDKYPDDCFEPSASVVPFQPKNDFLFWVKIAKCADVKTA